MEKEGFETKNSEFSNQKNHKFSKFSSLLFSRVFFSITLTKKTSKLLKSFLSIILVFLPNVKN